MRKKNIAIDTLTASLTQAVTLATATNPATSIACVAAIASIAGMTKEFINSRQEDIEGIAIELIRPETANVIRAMDEKQFIDDMFYSVDKILSQRTEPKRILMRSAFIGYLQAEHKSSYPLEKTCKVVENLTFADAQVFRKILKAEELRTSSKLPWISLEIMKSHNISEELQNAMMILTYTNDSQEQQSISSLIDEGLLSQQMKGVGQWDAGEGTPQLYVTAFGRYFTSYLENTDEP